MTNKKQLKNKEQAKNRLFWIGLVAILGSLIMTGLTQFYNISNFVFYPVIILMYGLLAYAGYLVWKFRKDIAENIKRTGKLRL